MSKEEVLSRMSPRDMIMGDQSDINEVACLLGKCRVLWRKPSRKSARNDGSKGAFLCKYRLVTFSPTKASPYGSVKISAYSGPDQSLEDINLSSSSVKEKQNVKSEDEDNENSLCNESLDSNGNGSQSVDGRDENDNQSLVKRDDDDGAISDGSLSSDDSESDDKKKLPLAEGSVNSGKIEVGERHQAVIPDLVEKGPYMSPREQPLQKVWEPNKIANEKVDEFLEDASKVLESYAKDMRLDISRSLPDLSASIVDDPEQTWHREFDKDKILALLHENRYDCPSTLRTIKAQPKIFITFWSKRDKELFNAGFQRHFSCLRMIKKDMGDSKSNKDVVDYHYRFKIPEQFIRYQDKKREQARRMLESIESHRLEEYLSSSVKSKKSSSSNAGGPKRLKQW